jgi:hypothetical protein
MNPNDSDIPSTSLPNPDDVFGDSEDEDDTPF